MRNPSWGGSDRATMLPEQWRPAPWTGDDPVTRLDRVGDWWADRCPLIGDTIVLAGVTAVLCALGVLIGEWIG